MSEKDLLPAQFNGARVLITGATGFTGQVLTEKLASYGAQITAIARDSSNIDAFSKMNINWVRGDVFDADTIAAATRDVDTIFHLAAAFREEKDNDEAYRKVHLYSTQLLAEQAIKNPSFKRFVHVSTVGVHGHIEDGLADENYRFSPGDGYQRTKLEAEHWLNEWAPKNGLPYSIVRPAPIYGPGDGRLLKIFKMINSGYLLILGKGKCIYHLVHVDDLTDIIMYAAIRDSALSETFIAAGEEPIPLEVMGKLIANHLGKKLRIIRLPIGPFFVAADVCKAICTPLGIQPPIYRRRVAFYTKDRKFNINKIKNVLGYTPRHSNVDGLAETADWYRKQHWL